MLSMRLRFPELLESKGVTPYALARDSQGRISLSTVYRLKKARGRIETFAADMLEAMCDVLGVTPGELFERDDNGATVVVRGRARQRNAPASTSSAARQRPAAHSAERAQRKSA